MSPTFHVKCVPSTTSRRVLMLREEETETPEKEGTREYVQHGQAMSGTAAWGGGGLVKGLRIGPILW